MIYSDETEKKCINKKRKRNGPKKCPDDCLKDVRVKDSKYICIDFENPI